jgi:hypothetical protein
MIDRKGNKLSSLAVGGCLNCTEDLMEGNWFIVERVAVLHDSANSDHTYIVVYTDKNYPISVELAAELRSRGFKIEDLHVAQEPNGGVNAELSEPATL